MLPGCANDICQTQPHLGLCQQAYLQAYTLFLTAHEVYQNSVTGSRKQQQIQSATYPDSAKHTRTLERNHCDSDTVTAAYAQSKTTIVVPKNQPGPLVTSKLVDSCPQLVGLVPSCGLHDGMHAHAYAHAARRRPADANNLALRQRQRPTLSWASKTHLTSCACRQCYRSCSDKNRPLRNTKVCRLGSGQTHHHASTQHLQGI